MLGFNLKNAIEKNDAQNNITAPYLESVNENGVFIDGKKLRGVTSYELKNSDDNKELVVRIIYNIEKNKNESANKPILSNLLT